MSDRLATRRMMVTLAASVLFPSTLNAAPQAPSMSGTSQATIGLSLSVRPRVTLHRDITAAREGNMLQTEGPCVRSTSSSLRLTVTLHRASQDPSSLGSDATLPAQTATRAGITCARNAHEFLGASPDQGRKSLLLLIAPD